MTIRKQGSTRTMKGFLTSTALAGVALAILAPATAYAQDPPAAAPSSNCPPGSWFCADAQQPAQPSVQPGQPLQPLPSPEAAKPALPPPAPPGGFAPPPPPPAAPPPPVVIYQPAPPIMVVQPRSEMPPRYNYTPRPAATWQRQREWGVNLHLIGAMMGKKAAPDASMGGFGLGLRYKPAPHLGLEAGIDHFDGRDYSGNPRDETAFSLNALVFVNPKSRAQVYFVGGVNWSTAQVKLDYASYDRTEYTYFGAQGGVGLELRAAKHFAFNIDVRGFIRGRTDDLARYTPEFRDENGRTTNVSGGGLLTAGMTFYF